MTPKTNSLIDGKVREALKRSARSGQAEKFVKGGDVSGTMQELRNVIPVDDEVVKAVKDEGLEDMISLKVITSKRA